MMTPMATKSTKTPEEIADDLNRKYRRLPPTIEEFIDGEEYLGLGGICCKAVREGKSGRRRRVR